MANHGRTKYEIRRSKIQQDLYTTKEDAVAAFQDFDEKYPHFMDSAQILHSKFFVSFCSPEMLQCNLPFADRSIVTDVTLKAVPKGYYYLCSSVIYIEQLQKHVFFYQAIIKSNSAQVFKQYAVALFRKFDIKLEQFLGVIMDFSAAQHEGFILALREVFGVKQHNALPFLKGCYMHWMQSVRRLSNNYQVVKPDDIDLFLKLVHHFRTTSNSIELYHTGQEILSKFPNSKKWLQWWLQPGVSSMIFRCKSLMKKELRQHKSRTSNAIEAFHSALYKLMPERRQPVATKINDGRAPDNNAALFGSKKRKQEVVIIGDEENRKRKKAKKLKTRGADLNAAINEHLDEVIEIEQNCPMIDDIADDNISDERSFLELLSDSDGRNDEADDKYHRTENLENDIKDMFKGAGVSVEDVVVNSDESFESSVIGLLSSPIIKTKSKPTASKMRAPTDSDFSLSSSSSNLPCLASNDKHIDPIIQSIQKSTSATIIDLSSPPMLPEILASVAIEPIASSSTTTADQPSLENDSSTAAGFLLPQKRTSLLQKYQWLVKDYQNNHPDSHPSLPLPTYIVSNESNSCFIDAFIELLFNAVLPFVDMSFADENNAYDCLLMNAFESYSQQSPFGIRAATSTVRHFVWNMTEYKLVSGVRQLVKSFCGELGYRRGFIQ
ncbi:uncharacterized protein ATC70_009299 [Mucor velutinosus]|uniref:Uncharacterized protein n=1 Tax=Mucor velutinosus TaxID=708070 RepID=A0AAN7I2G4_9FUNG|nr:hypothetical protein ATC70_009299 [Mucor velutinosus]